MKTRTIVILLTAGIFLFGMISCEQEQTAAGMRDALEGEWKVDENSEFYRKSATGVYNVYISLSTQDTTGLYIANFYQLTYENEVRATLDNGRIILDPGQEVTLLNSLYKIVEGTGVVSSDYQSINWTYQVDDLSGEIDHVTATYSRVDK
ncbi:MAG TPA: hypothetical protein VJ876_05810 [Bacteroidales bacterium]|nr:hypothetical protein [Bacteroidales bacterium]